MIKKAKNKTAKAKNKNSAGGNALASIDGYHSLLGLRSHNKISKSEFARRSRLMLAQLNAK